MQTDVCVSGYEPISDDTRKRSLAYIGHGFTAGSFKCKQACTHYY